jgi:DNA polymerase I-like protein with 3'-5' exonuclease and polymerase domains
MFESEHYSHSTLQECYDYCSKQRVLAIDTETTGLDFTVSKVIMLQIGDEHHQWAIDTRTENISILFPLFKSKDIVKVFANGKFDITMLQWNYGAEFENVCDIQLMEKVLNKSTISFKLVDILKRRTNRILNKNVRLNFVTKGSIPFTDEEIIYGLDDIIDLIPVARQQFEEASELNLTNTINLENEVLLAFCDIEVNGLKLDQKPWMELYHQAVVESHQIELELDNIVLKTPELEEFILDTIQSDLFTPIEDLRKVGIKWTSPKQVLNVFQKLIPELTGVNATLDLGIHKGKFAIIDAYIDYKEHTKLVTSYGEDFITKHVKQDGKVHTNFFQILETGRVSSSNPNMQQIPANNDYRNCFIPSKPGWVFVSSDFSSQELCIIAHGSQDPVWLKALEEGKDLHSVCAELVFKEKWFESADEDCAYYKDKAQAKCNCKEHGKLRTFVKTINFGLAYGMSAHKLHDSLRISLEEADLLIDNYFSTFPSIKGFLTKLGDFANNYGYITTYPPYYRRRWFENWGNSADYKTRGKVERAGKNTPIQGSGADMTKLGMVLIRREIKDKDLPVKMVMVVHDQIDTECEESYSSIWEIRMTELMEEAALKIIPSGLLKSDTHITSKWNK